MSFAIALGNEFRKLRRSPAPLSLGIAFSFLPLVLAFFFLIMKYPERALRLGLIGQKAAFVVGSVDWQGYAAMFVEMLGLGGIVVYSIIVAYLFGREYAEGTAKIMLTLPARRSHFVLAKSIVASLWFTGLCALVSAEALAAGLAIDMPGFSIGLVLDCLSRSALLLLMVLCLGPAVAWIAIAGRGYLAPLGFAIFSMILAMVFGATGWSVYVPWSIVAVFSGAAGPDAPPVGAVSWAILVLFAIISFAGAARTLELADNTQ